MTLEIASGEQERDDSQKEKNERNEVYIRFFDGIPVRRVGGSSLYDRHSDRNNKYASTFVCSR